jgi:hypothetical protein
MIYLFTDQYVSHYFYNINEKTFYSHDKYGYWIKEKILPNLWNDILPFHYEIKREKHITIPVDLLSMNVFLESCLFENIVDKLL